MPVVCTAVMPTCTVRKDVVKLVIYVYVNINKQLLYVYFGYYDCTELVNSNKEDDESFSCFHFSRL